MTWRKKSLALAEWSQLQTAFGNLQMVRGGPEDLAMFAKGIPGSDLTEIYITGPGLEVIEARSPGGWEDTAAPSGENLSLLVGAGDPWRYFGIEQ